MKSLVKKELAEALVPATVLFVPLSIVWFGAMRTREVMWQPLESTAITVLCTAGFAGVIFGYCQFAAERWRKTLGYALHRGTSDADVFTAKVIAGVISTAFLGIGPPLLYGIVHKLTAEDRAILQMQRIVEMCWIATIGISAYGLGALVSQLHRAWWKEAVFAVVGGGALALIALRASMMTPDDPGSHAAQYVAVQAVIGAVLLAVAYRLFLYRGDRDMPMPSASHALLAIVGLVLFVLPLDFVAASAENEALKGLRESYPVILRERASGRVFAAAADDRGGYLEIDSAGRVVNTRPLAWGDRGERPEPFEFVYRGLWTDPLSYPPVVLNGRWIHVRFLQGGTPVSTVASASGRFIINGFFDPHTGEFHAIFDEFEHGNSPVLRPDLVLPRALPMEVVIDKPRGDGRFSAHTAMVQPLEPRGERPRAAQREMPPLHAPLCAVDLEDHSLWRIDPLDLRKPAREVTLPGGDRFVRLESAYVSGEARPRSFSGWCDVVLDDGSRVVAYGSDLIIAGERGLYAWNGSELTPFERDPSASVTDLEIVTGSHAAAGVLAYVDRDPIAPSVEVKSIDDSKVLFRFDYGPRNSHEHVTVAMIYAVNLVRSPLACVISFLTPASPTRASGGWSGVPLLYDQHRAWLLIAVLALAFFYTRSVIRTLSLRGASSWTIGVWALVTAIFGVYAYLLFRILEPRGALARVAEPAASPAPLLIESHATGNAHAAGSI